MPGEKIYNACDIRKFMKHLTDGTDSYRQERAKNLKQMHNKQKTIAKGLQIIYNCSCYMNAKRTVIY